MNILAVIYLGVNNSVVYGPWVNFPSVNEPKNTPTSEATDPCITDSDFKAYELAVQSRLRLLFVKLSLILISSVNIPLTQVFIL